MDRIPILDKARENGVFDPETWAPARKQAEEQIARLRGWVEKSPGQALATAAVAGLVLGLILKRR